MKVKKRKKKTSKWKIQQIILQRIFYFKIDEEKREKD